MSESAEAVKAAQELPSAAKRLFNMKELSAYLSMPKATIYTWVCMQKIPPACVVRMGRSLRFEKAFVDRWVNELRGS
ncbi:MAG: helix-turn-helix domain-containing protein [bacterium]